MLSCFPTAVTPGIQLGKDPVTIDRVAVLPPAMSVVVDPEFPRPSRLTKRAGDAAAISDLPIDGSDLCPRMDRSFGEDLS